MHIFMYAQGHTSRKVAPHNLEGDSDSHYKKGTAYPKNDESEHSCLPSLRRGLPRPNSTPAYLCAPDWAASSPWCA